MSISNAVRFAKQREVYEDCETAVQNLSKKIANEYEAKGNVRQDAIAYTSGYMMSVLTNLIADLPNKQRKEIIDNLTRRAAQ